MSTPRIENLHPGKDANEGKIGDHVVSNLYGKGAEKMGPAEEAMFKLIEANTRNIANLTEQVVQHFGTVLGRVPESMQDHFVANLDCYQNKPNEVVWNRFAEAYHNKGNVNPMSNLMIG